MVHQVLQAASVALLREKASARGRRIVRKAELRRELHLRLTLPPRKPKKLRPVDETIELGLRRLEELRGERPHQSSLEAAGARHHAKRLASLAHRALVHHFSCRHEVEPTLAHDLAGAAYHGRMAVYARVHRPAVAVRRVLHKGYLVSGKVNYSERESKRLCRLARGAGGEERRLERNAFHVCARLAEHADGKLRVETAAEK